MCEGSEGVLCTYKPKGCIQAAEENEASVCKILVDEEGEEGDAFESRTVAEGTDEASTALEERGEGGRRGREGREERGREGEEREEEGREGGGEGGRREGRGRRGRRGRRIGGKGEEREGGGGRRRREEEGGEGREMKEREEGVRNILQNRAIVYCCFASLTLLFLVNLLVNRFCLSVSSSATDL